MTTNMQVYKCGTGNCFCLEQPPTEKPQLWRGFTGQPAFWPVGQYDGNPENEQEITDRFSQDDLVDILAQYLF